MRKFLLAVLLFLSLPGVAVAAPATPLVVPTLATLQGYTALTMSLNPNIYLTGTTAGSTTGAAHYSWEATYVGSPDGTLVIAPSDHPGTCASGCMVRATPAAVAGGSNTQVQYNNAGALGGISGATSNGTSLTVSSGNLKLSGSSSGTSTLNAPATGGGTATLFPGTDTVTGNDATQTLTNKSISGSANTMTNIGNSSLVNSSTTVNGTTCTLGASCTVTAGSITVGTTTISGGTSGRIEYNNAGVLGEKAVTGTGDVVLATSPTLVTPTLGVATATTVNGSTLAVPTQQRFTSGTAATYTTPANVRQIRVRMVGGGAGGQGVAVSGTYVNGSAGGTTTFKDVTALGGAVSTSSGSLLNATPGGAGGSGGSDGTGTTSIFRVGGGGAGGGANVTNVTNCVSGTGGSSFFGGAGFGVYSSGGAAAQTNSGSGGSGGAVNAASQVCGAGGGAGEYVEFTINNPAASYTYTVGTAGSGGSSTQNGGAGAAGQIIVGEFY